MEDEVAASAILSEICSTHMSSIRDQSDPLAQQQKISQRGKGKAREKGGEGRGGEGSSHGSRSRNVDHITAAILSSALHCETMAVYTKATEVVGGSALTGNELSSSSFSTLLSSSNSSSSATSTTLNLSNTLAQSTVTQVAGSQATASGTDGAAGKLCVKFAQFCEQTLEKGIEEKEEELEKKGNRVDDGTYTSIHSLCDMTWID